MQDGRLPYSNCKFAQLTSCIVQIVLRARGCSEGKSTSWIRRDPQGIGFFCPFPHAVSTPSPPTCEAQRVAIRMPSARQPPPATGLLRGSTTSQRIHSAPAAAQILGLASRFWTHAPPAGRALTFWIPANPHCSPRYESSSRLHPPHHPRPLGQCPRWCPQPHLRLLPTQHRSERRGTRERLVSKCSNQ